MSPTTDVPRLDARGHLALVLHAHQPFVREPGGDPTHAEKQLFAAISRCYVPLLEALAGLARERVPYRLALAISPSLLGMLTDPVVQSRYRRHLDASLASLERGPHEDGETAACPTSGLDREALRRVRRAFVETWSGDLVNALRQLQDDGFVETLAGAATHAYLPHLSGDPSAVRAQIRIGLDEHHRILGRRATGFWLPEGAYDDGLDALLVDHGVSYGIAGAQAVTRGTPRPAMGVWMPIVSAGGLVLIAPDGEARDQIDGANGYAADPDYRPGEIGRAATGNTPRDHAAPEAAAEAAAEAMAPATQRAAARAKVEAHASNFVASRARQIESLAGAMQHPPLVVAALDAEILGVRWLAGPEWIAATIRKIAYDQHLFALVTPSDHLAAWPLAQEVCPAATGGDAEGHHVPWLGGENDWIRVPLSRAARRMRELARRHEDATGTTLRALDQAARELLLAQSSDWPYRMSRGPLVNDAVRRLRTHLARFARLARELDSGAVDPEWLAEVEARDNLFPALDHRAFR